MKKKKALIATILAGALAMGSTITVMAYPTTNAASGAQHTTFGVVEGTYEDFGGQANFEVPLYVTVAAISNDSAAVYNEGDYTKMMTPTGYDIYNASRSQAVAVDSIVVRLYDTATWSIVDTTPTTDKQMQFSIGDLELKPMSTTGVKQVSYRVGATENTAANQYRLEDGTFATETGGYKDIPRLSYLSTLLETQEDGIPLKGTVRSAVRNYTGSTAAQFQVIYNLVPTDGAGNARQAAAYVGDDWKAAGYDKLENAVPSAD